MAARRLIYQVAIGPIRPLWGRCLESVATYCRRHGIDHLVQREMVLKVVPKHSHRSPQAIALGGLPNLEKLAGLAHFDTYDQIALIDADVWMAPDAPNIFDEVNPAADVAGVTERSLPITTAYARKLDGYERSQFGPLHGVGLPFLQCGVMVYNRSFARFLPDGPKAFWEQPCLERFINGEGAFRWQSEQTTLNWFLREKGAIIQLLPPKWNMLFGATTTLEGAAAVHFFLSDHLKGEDPEEMIRTGKGRARV